MSIIIASLDYQNKSVYIGTDRRQVQMSGAPVEEEITKLLEIRPNLYYAINGDVNNGRKLGDLLLKLKHLPVSEIISTVENFEVVTHFAYGAVQGDCVFVLAGIHEDGEPFLSATYTKWKKSWFVRATKRSVMRVIAAPNDDTAAKVSEVFNNYLQATNNDHVKSIMDSIRYAASIDHTISPTFNFMSAQASFTATESNKAVTGVLIVGNAAGENNAGITGVVDKGEESIRFYAGVYIETKT